MSLESIEKLAQRYARDRELVAAQVAVLEAEIATAKRARIGVIRGLVARAKTSQLELHQAIDQERSLFEKPKSRILHGIRLGLRKGKGKLIFESAERVIKLIRKHFPDQADVLIVTEEKPAKDALANLPAADLKRIGCEVEGTGELVFIKPADSEVDKLVDALLGDAEDE